LVVFLAPALLYSVVFMVLPYLNLLQFGFWRVENYVVVPDLTFSNYRRAFENPLYLTVIWNSFQVATITTLASVVLGYGVAFYLVFFSGRAKQLLYFLVVIPLWTSFLLRAFIWRIILGREGIINSSLLHFGVIDQPVSLLLFNKFSVCLALVYVFVPFVALPVYAALEKIPREYIEAGMDLGGSFATTFRDIILPLSMPGIIAGAIFTFCLSFGDFVAPSLLGGPSGIMISSIIINQFGSAFDWPFGSALAVIVVAIVGGGVVVVSKLERRQYD
jgi:spermidine/putrescine transport system permease protein